MAKRAQVYATDGVLERVWYDMNRNGVFDMHDAGGDNFDTMGMARWDQYSDLIYTDHDYSCENAGRMGDGTDGSGDRVYYEGSSYLQNNCLQKGDLLVLPSFTTNTLDKDTLGRPFDHVVGEDQLGNTLDQALATKNSAGLYEIMKIWTNDWTKDT